MGRLYVDKTMSPLHYIDVSEDTSVAHSEVYGYGFRPYEYLSPPQGNFSSRAAEAEAQLGMYGLRSFILPKLFMVVFTLAETIGIKDQPFLVAKVFHATVSSFLPLSMFKLTNALYSSYDAGVMAAILGAASLHLSLFGTHVLVNSFLSPFVFWAIASILDILLSKETTNARNEETIDSNGGQRLGAKSGDSRTSMPIESRLFVWGTLLGICSYIRVDLLLFLAVFFCPFVFITLKASVQYMLIIIKLCLGFAVGVTVAGLDDYISYGRWFLSVFQWIRFNLGTNLAATFFGRDVGTKYVEQLFLCNWPTFLITAMTVSVLVLQTVTSGGRQLSEGRFGTNISLFGVCSTLLIVYSMQPHKEIRFLHNMIVVWYVLQSQMFLDLIRLIQTVVQYKGNFQRNAIYAIPLCYIIISWASFPNSSDGSYMRWIFNNDDGSHDVNQCLYYVSRQNDVRGVFLSKPMQNSGVYTLLHKDVPLLTLLHQEFCEYSNESRLIVPSVNPLRLSQYNMSLSVVNRVSDYITSQNLPYVYTRLVEGRRYNYAIIPREVDFGDLGYNEVYRSGILKVVRRFLGGKSEKAAKAFIEDMPFWTNATVLEYEGGWLLSLGNPTKALPRLEHALTLDGSRIRLYQLLTTAYKKTGKVDKAVKTQQNCFQRHGQEKCLQFQAPVELYSMYAKRAQEFHR